MNKLLVFLLLWLPLTAMAHKTSNGFVYIDTQTRSGRVDLAVADLLRITPLDNNADGKVTWEELQLHTPYLRNYIIAHLQISAAGSECLLQWQMPALTAHAEGYFLAFPFSMGCPASKAWQLRYTLLFERDALHRGLVRWQNANGEGLDVISPDEPELLLPDGASSSSASPSLSVSASLASALRILHDYFVQGVHHLLVGYDHILFLMALLLPVMGMLSSAQSSVASENASTSTWLQRAWASEKGLRPAVFDTLRVVTLFTLAHSMTLALSALDIVRMPGTLIEVMIALSVSAAGVVALIPSWHPYRGVIAFGFGLVHGFGFANVLFELSPSVSQRVVALAGFNLGVEAGQAGIILLALPMSFALRFRLRRWVWTLPASAYVIVLCGLVWAWQRWP